MLCTRHRQLDPASQLVLPLSVTEAPVGPLRSLGHLEQVHWGPMDIWNVPYAWDPFLKYGKTFRMLFLEGKEGFIRIALKSLYLWSFYRKQNSLMMSINYMSWGLIALVAIPALPWTSFVTMRKLLSFPFWKMEHNKCSLESDCEDGMNKYK